MIDPSSSEEESEEEQQEEQAAQHADAPASSHAHPHTHAASLEVPAAPTRKRSMSPGSAVSSETLSAGTAASLARPTSPSPSVVSEKAEADLQDKQEREEEERKRKIQLYVFISRCIAYPFNAKQPTDMTRRQTKITKQQLDVIQGRFQSFLKGDTQIMADEAFQNAVQSYYEVFLKSERVLKMVQSGACSQHDFREVFRNNIEKRVRSDWSGGVTGQ
ncbi:calcium-dependent secretion activator-like [Schistocerca piceifrons]|uniref:calcium-dependent secretion activator-like n=1 Tax=Schistocerca piceifrons TaxID=274613 RepID=UPI001F5FEB5F|nr:calcium-dependent secretion activator-like [Schistocerca piceifrons]